MLLLLPRRRGLTAAPFLSFLLTLALTLALALALLLAAPAAPARAGTLTAFVGGSLYPASSVTAPAPVERAFAGVLSVSQFEARPDGTLAAVGTLFALVFEEDGFGRFDLVGVYPGVPFALPVRGLWAGRSEGFPYLALELGPLELGEGYVAPLYMECRLPEVYAPLVIGLGRQLKAGAPAPALAGTLNQMIRQLP